jgi:hypothetical protein
MQFRTLSGVDGLAIGTSGSTLVISASGQNPVKTSITGNGSTTTYAINGATSVNPNNYRVDIDGVLQEPLNDYTISGSNIVFTSAPPNGSKVTVISNNLVRAYDIIPSDGSVTNVKVAGDAGISGTKISPNFGNQSVRIANTRTFGGENTSGTVDAYYIPNWTDNKTYLQYGSTGMYIRDASGNYKAEFINNNIKIWPGNFLYAYGSYPGATERNIAFGGAFTNLTTGDSDHNTGLGALAGFNLQRGSYNTLIGAGAGYNYVSTSTSVEKGGNTFVGAYAGFQLDTSGTADRAESNTVVGAFSLSPPNGANTAHTFQASGNVVIGNFTLGNCTPGAFGGERYENNVMLGRFAGNQLSAGASNCIYIGYNVVGISTNNNNYCRIGNSDITNVQFGTGAAFPSTGSAANVVYGTATGRMFVSTSSLRYKKDIENIQDSFSENIIYQSRPIWYKSADTYAEKVKEDFPVNWSYWGFIAEEIAEIDPRLVTWSYLPENYEEYVSFVDPHTGEEVKDKRIKEGATKVPNGINYDRFTVHLVKIAQKQKQEIDNLKTLITSLENRISALES